MGKDELFDGIFEMDARDTSSLSKLFIEPTIDIFP